MIVAMLLAPAVGTQFNATSSKPSISSRIWA
jgi:hypothetical protein